MSAEQRTARLLHRSADRYLTGTPNVKKSVDILYKNREPLQTRLDEFHQVLPSLALTMQQPDLNHLDYFMTNYLRMELEGKPLPLPEEIALTKDKWLNQVAKDTFLTIDQKIKNADWEFPHVVINQGMMISGLLIEGYGEFLGKLYDNPELSRAFVLAFEEVLWHQYQDSQLLKDVLPWMIEEKRELAYNVGKALEELTPESQKQKATKDAPFTRLLTDQRIANSDFGLLALREAQKENDKKLEEQFGKDWEGALITPLSVFMHGVGIVFDHIDVGTVKTLFTVGYELKDYEKLNLVIDDVAMFIAESLTPASTSDDRIRFTALQLMSFLQEGMNIGRMSDSERKLTFDPQKLTFLAGRLATTLRMLRGK